MPSNSKKTCTPSTRYSKSCGTRHYVVGCLSSREVTGELPSVGFFYVCILQLHETRTNVLNFFVARRAFLFLFPTVVVRILKDFSPPSSTTLFLGKEYTLFINHFNIRNFNKIEDNKKYLKIFIIFNRYLLYFLFIYFLFIIFLLSIFLFIY